MFREPVYLVGPRYSHHAVHSGYDGFNRYVGAPLEAPIGSRFLSNYLGWWVDTKISELISRPGYSVGLLLIEAAAALHMLRHRKSLYHVLYGDTDLWLLARVRRATGNPLVATFHEPPPGLEWLRIDHRATEGLAAVILVSESQRAHFGRFLPPERIFVLPHGIDTGYLCPAEQLADEPVCITVGSHWRDFETLALAIDLVLEVDPSVRFVALGTHRGKKGRFQHPRVEFRQDVADEELLRAYRASRIAVFSFEQATASNALLEAMACGLPIVATDVGGVREYLGAEAGVLCTPEDPEALATGVLRLLRDPRCARRMGAAGRARALAFDYRVVADQLDAVYSRVLARGQP